MARTKTTPTHAVIDLAPEQVRDIVEATEDGVERMAVILRQFGDGLPFDEARYEHVIRGHLSRSAEEMLAAGRALIVAKEYLGHGSWMPFIERIGVEHTVAKRMMQAAYKFSNGASTHHLIEAAGNKTKLFELLSLDDEEIKELSDGGTVAGLNLDEISTMSTSELRKALRDAKAEKQVQEKLMEGKNTKIDNLQTALEKAKQRLTTLTPDEKVTEATQNIAAATLGAQSAIDVTLRMAIRDLVVLHPASAELIAGHVAQVRASLDALMAEEGIQVMTADVPDWAKGA